MYKKIYYMLMTAGSFAIVVMLGIIVMLLASCSSFPPFTPDKGIDLTTPPNVIGEEYIIPMEGIVCCLPDKDFPLSCGGWRVCEFNSKGDLI
jgi:hypothetical protein